ncbi:hypothetical protein Ahy_B03g065632 [Arachis hypogaea]|uniref:Uncharacterized protein n=1 Tax=Arachis hypogaea TaxID=3818 RepID=A0A445A218_ARAHY|nr:hypothetical protein Ahy_B03g065632 [Arachis hypogaea]
MRGVTFSSKKQIDVFVNLSMSLMDLKNSTLQKLGKCDKKRVKQVFFFRISISLRQGYVKFGRYEILDNNDIQVIFHSQARFLNLDAMELFAIMIDVEGISSGSTSNPPIDLSVQTNNVDELGDVHTFGELAAAMRVALVLDDAPVFMEVRNRDPLVEAIGDDGLDSEPPIIGDDTNGEEDTTCVRRSRAQSSSQTKHICRVAMTRGPFLSDDGRYLPHLEDS